MMDAYSLDSELKIYSKTDRKIALEQVIGKLGVAGSTDVKLKCDSKNSDKLNKSLYLFDNIHRSLSPLVPYTYKQHKSYFKYLILYNENKNKIALLYNVCMYETLIEGVGTDNRMNTDPDEVVLEAECLFKINDVWEAVRLIECSAIDIGVEEYLKDIYSDC